MQTGFQLRPDAIGHHRGPGITPAGAPPAEGTNVRVDARLTAGGYAGESTGAALGNGLARLDVGAVEPLPSPLRPRRVDVEEVVDTALTAAWDLALLGDHDQQLMREKWRRYSSTCIAYRLGRVGGSSRSAGRAGAAHPRSDDAPLRAHALDRMTDDVDEAGVGSRTRMR